MKLGKYSLSHTLKNILTLVSGTFAAQLIAIIAQPFLRRIIPSEEFGVYAVYMSVVGIITTVITLRYDLAIVLPKKQKVAENLVVGGILISFILSILLFLPLFLMKTELIRWLKIPENYYHWFYLLPLSIFFAGSYRILNNWLIRQKAFRKSTENKMLRRGTEAATQIALGSLGQSIALFLGDLLGSLANFFIGIRQARKTKFQIEQVTVSYIKKSLIEYKKFPLYNSVPVLFNTAALLMPVILINRLFNEQITAYFDLTRQILGLTLSLVAAAVSQVYLQKLAEKKNRKQKLLPDIIKASKILGILSILGIIIIELFGEQLFSIIFGHEYFHSGVYAKILVISFGIRFIVTPQSIAFISLERLKLNAIWQIGYFILISSLFFLKNVSIEDLLIRYMTIDLIAYSIYYFLIIRIVKQHDNTIKTDND